MTLTIIAYLYSIQRQDCCLKITLTRKDEREIRRRMMEKFSWLYFLVFMLPWLAMLVSAGIEETLLPNKGKKPNVPFVYHGGLCWAPIILAYIAGNVMPYMVRYCKDHQTLSSVGTVIAASISIAITRILTEVWWPKSPDESCSAQIYHIRSLGDKKFWYRDIMFTGWIFGFYMATMITLGFDLLFTPMPQKVLRETARLLYACSFLGIFAVNLMVNRARNDNESIRSRIIALLQTLGFLLLIWVVYNCKL